MADNTGVVVTIPWDDGSGDSFYMDFSRVSEEESIISLSSDFNNTRMARTKILRFRPSGGNTSGNNINSQADAVLRIVQQVDNLIVATFEQTYSVYGDNQMKAGWAVTEGGTQNG